jgi:hypothetical protein
MNKEIKMEDWIGAFQKYQSDRVEAIPPGWLSIEEVAEKFSRGVTQTRTILKTMVPSGQVEKRRFRMVCGDQIHTVFYYRLIGSNPSKKT